jgi:prepilin-type N-terminal cleavage/methylation domain-containing protein
MKKSISPIGFTLIEILVVISIISILATVLYSSFNDARESSRDRALMSEVKSVQLAIELYKAQNGTYPSDTGVLVPNFIADLPTSSDSVNAACNIDYEVAGDQTWYKLTAEQCVSDNTTIGQGGEMARCPASCAGSGICDPDHENFASSFAVYSFGGKCE